MKALGEADLPVRVANLSTIWTVCYTRPSRYNWMLQYYLRAEGLALSWVGTGRLIFSLNYSDADFLAVAERFVAAASRSGNPRQNPTEPRPSWSSTSGGPGLSEEMSSSSISPPESANLPCPSYTRSLSS